MYPIGHVKVSPLPLQQSDGDRLCLPFKSDLNTLIEVRAGCIENLVLHHHQPCHLFATKGNLIVVTLQKQQYDYIVLSAQKPDLVEIPPKTPYGLINLSTVSCFLFCSGWGRGSVKAQDCCVLKPPFPYDIARVMQLLHDMKDSPSCQPMLRAL